MTLSESEIRVFDLPKVIKKGQLVERTHTLVFRQRQDIDRERKLDIGFSWEDEGASKQDH